MNCAVLSFCDRIFHFRGLLLLTLTLTLRIVIAIPDVARIKASMQVIQ
jgi:hypothetical protein